MIINITLLILGFILLIKCADFFVDGASSLARNFKLSTMFIGLTIVSFGTSAPEFAVSIQSLLKGSGDFVLGNVIGSNILNILLIIGICAIFHNLKVQNNTVKKELPITLLFTTLFIVMMKDTLFGLESNSFSRQDGIIMLLFFTIFIYYLLNLLKNNKKENKNDEIPKYSIWQSIVFTIIGIIGIIAGSDLVVSHASSIASMLGISERMISLTVVALGTSLPELVTSITATRKGEYDIAIGNIVGSNIFNLGIVLALPVAILGGIPDIAFNNIDLLFLFASSVILFLFSFHDRKITKPEGFIMLSVFFIYYSYVLFT